MNREDDPRILQSAEDLKKAGEAVRDILFETNNNTVWLVISLPDGAFPGIATNVDSPRVVDFLRFVADFLVEAREKGDALVLKNRNETLN